MIDGDNDSKIDFLLVEINQLLERLEQNQLSDDEKVILDQYCQEFFGYIDNLKKEQEEDKLKLLDLYKIRKAQNAYLKEDN